MENWIYNNSVVEKHSLYPLCNSTLNEVSNRDYPNTNYFNPNIKCLDMDTYEKNILRKSYANHTADAVIGISTYENNQELNPRLLLIELRIGYESTSNLSKTEIEAYLKERFNLRQVLWLEDGYLAGDDTDSHIDTLARLCPDHTIVYVQCTDSADEHYEALKRMEEQLKSFRTLDGTPYRLLPLPMAAPAYADGERLPATYANFLIMNEAVLYPTYNHPEKDAEAARILGIAFPQHEIVGIDCSALIKQHGSLHCVTMQYPEGVFPSPNQ